MNSTAKGIYPSWVSDKDIINQVLNEITREGGHLHYSFVVNPEHPPDVQARMKNILDKMQAEKLIIHSNGETDFLEIDVEGSRAVVLGYRKYNRTKKWDGLRYTINRILLVILCLLILSVVAGLVYFIRRIFK